MKAVGALGKAAYGFFFTLTHEDTKNTKEDFCPLSYRGLHAEIRDEDTLS